MLHSRDVVKRFVPEQELITHISFINSPEKLRRSESIVDKISGKTSEDKPPVSIESQQFGFPDEAGLVYFEML